MSWECQGRQYHAWFGSGTCADALDALVLDPATVTDVAYSAFGYLPQNQRRPYESWLRHGGLKQLASALPGWAAGSGLPRETFRERYFGEHGDGVVAAHAQDAGAELTGLGPRDDGRKARAAAGQSLASLVKAARPEALGRVMAVAARRAAAAPKVAAATKVAKLSPKEQNIRDLAVILYNEARGETRDAQIAVAHTVLNRMQRNGVTMVHEVWGGYSHRAPNAAHQEPGAMAAMTAVAKDVIEGRIADPTGGATHYYSPKHMPIEGEPTAHKDVRGGLESVPGITDPRTHLPANSYRPSFAPEFDQVTVPGIIDKDFKFFRPKDGVRHVR